MHHIMKLCETAAKKKALQGEKQLYLARYARSPNTNIMKIVFKQVNLIRNWIFLILFYLRKTVTSKRTDKKLPINIFQMILLCIVLLLLRHCSNPHFHVWCWDFLPPLYKCVFLDVYKSATQDCSRQILGFQTLSAEKNGFLFFLY